MKQLEKGLNLKFECQFSQRLKAQAQLWFFLKYTWHTNCKSLQDCMCLNTHTHTYIYTLNYQQKMVCVDVKGYITFITYWCCLLFFFFAKLMLAEFIHIKLLAKLSTLGYLHKTQKHYHGTTLSQNRKPCQKSWYLHKEKEEEEKVFMCCTFSFPALSASLSIRYVATAICFCIEPLCVKSFVYAVLMLSM